MLIRIWRCHDGRRIPVNEMHDRHLENAINMIYRGYDKDGRRVTYRTRSLLAALLVERTIREIRRDVRNYNNSLWG
jgi:hypothetical protein